MGFIEVRTLLQIEVRTPLQCSQYTKSKYNADGQQHNTVNVEETCSGKVVFLVLAPLVL